ncbi:MAG: flippase-like domain-containing protein [Saprospiraceae bacterium]|nr:flippase-like domain-containing protein [Saprospiraceae bacterium]MBK7736301.1 flippase-like domain-containing protein [Saprospiraceae bacterium]MBK7912333.1 flippase-like domain-containing protein [Saprospiraceae bacterium]
MLSQIQAYKIPSVLKLVIKILISILIIYIISRNVNISQLIGFVLKSNVLFIGLAMLLFIASKIVSAVRYQLFLQGEAVNVSFSENLKLYYLGMYYNLLLPGGISGDGYKIKVLMQNFNKDLKLLLKLTLMDRFSGVWALMQISLGLLLLLKPLVAYFWLIGILLIASIGLPWALNKIFKWMDSRSYGRIHLISLGVQLLQTGSAICLIVALGQKLHWIPYSFLFLISSLAAMLPITFGGAGAREVTFLYGTQYLQTEAESGVAIAFLFYLISTIVSFFGIIYSFKPIKFSNKEK